MFHRFLLTAILLVVGIFRGRGEFVCLLVIGILGEGVSLFVSAVVVNNCVNKTKF